MQQLHVAVTVSCHNTICHLSLHYTTDCVTSILFYFIYFVQNENVSYYLHQGGNVFAIFCLCVCVCTR